MKKKIQRLLKILEENEGKWMSAQEIFDLMNERWKHGMGFSNARGIGRTLPRFFLKSRFAWANDRWQKLWLIDLTNFYKLEKRELRTNVAKK